MAVAKSKLPAAKNTSSKQQSQAPFCQRYFDQRWLLDATVASVGLEWDQPRALLPIRACGAEAMADMRAIAAQVKRYDDIAPAYEAAAWLRESKAKAAEAEGNPITARDNYLLAAVLWGGAQWPLHENSADNIRYNEHKNACYLAWARNAPHPVERVEISLGKATFPAYLHLPAHAGKERLPAVISIPGMDSFKELSCAQHGDNWLERGMALLAIDGPGQGECLIRNLHCTTDNFEEVGRATYAYLASRPEIDPQRIGVNGVSMGSFWAIQAAAAEPRIKACASSLTCLEPGMETIFNAASPTFKIRYMYMSGYHNEAQFDKFAKTLSPLPAARRLRCPLLVVGGEKDQLSPVEHSHKLMEVVKSPRRLVIYQGDRHSLGATPAPYRGPSPAPLITDWMQQRLAGKAFPSESWFVKFNGEVIKTPLD